MYEQNKQRLRAQYNVEYVICLFLQVSTTIDHGANYNRSIL